MSDALVEELRRLDPDEVYEAALAGLTRLRSAGTNGSGQKASTS